MVPVVAGFTRPIKRNGPELFAELPEVDQRAILGNAAQLAYKDGAVSLEDFVGQRYDPQWGSMRYAKSLRQVLGDDGAKRYIKQAAQKIKPEAIRIDPTKLMVGNFKTTDEAKAWLEYNYPRIKCDFTGAHIDTINPTIAEFDRLAKRYPLVAEKLERITTDVANANVAIKDYWAFASRDRTTIGLNPKYYGDPQLLIDGLKSGEIVGWHPPGCNTIESIMTHEFGHQVEHWLLSENMTAFYDGPIGADGFGLVTDTVSAWLNGHKATKALSDYAVTTNNKWNREEGWAEAFASIGHTPKGYQTKFTKDLAKLLDLVADSTKWKQYDGAASVPWLSNVPQDERQKYIDTISAMRKRIGL